MEISFFFFSFFFLRSILFQKLLKRNGIDLMKNEGTLTFDGNLMIVQPIVQYMGRNYTLVISTSKV